tara:strand:- start:304 stop:573 length:270 start_codon:yes stop_codon:yes gene_type:complete
MWKPPTSTGTEPDRKLKTLVVLMAFVRDEEGELRPAFEAREVPSEDRAKMDAKRMAALGTLPASSLGRGQRTWSMGRSASPSSFSSMVI